MKICPFCATSNREGIFFCEECGHAIYMDLDVGSTQKFQPPANMSQPPQTNWGTARFDQKAHILLRVRNHPQAIELRPQQELIIGRRDPNSAPLSIDMTPYNAFENGISRIHAAIRRGEDTLMLVDLGSVNGTHLNGSRLAPNQPRVLRDGDEIRLGKLIMNIYFKIEAT
jgi:FHA domain